MKLDIAQLKSAIAAQGNGALVIAHVDADMRSGQLPSGRRMLAVSPPVTLALVARILELESELRGCADALAGIGPVPQYDDVLDIANKGVVVE